LRRDWRDLVVVLAPTRLRFARWAFAWGGWLVALAGAGALTWFLIATSTESETQSTESKPPFAQVGRQDNDAPVWSLAFSPGATFLAWGTIAGDLYLKHLATGRTLLLQHGPGGSTRSLAFSSDDRLLAATGNDNALRLWDTEAGTELAGLGDGAETGRCVAFSRAGKLLALGSSESVWPHRGIVTIWDWEGRRRLITLHDHSASINILAFAPDGTRLMSGDVAGIVKLWDVTTGRERATLRACQPGTGVTAMVISPDGALLVTAGLVDRSVRIWDATNGEPRGELPRTDSGVTDLAFSPDGTTLAMAQGDGTATLWGVAPPREQGSLRAQGRALQSVAFSSDGRLLATGGMDGAIRFWDIAQVLGGQSSAKDRARGD
jgi:WD40 repeat protein